MFVMPSGQAICEVSAWRKQPRMLTAPRRLPAHLEAALRRSSNERLERIFAANPEYVNRELTLPCRVEETPVFISPLVSRCGLAEAVESHLRTIVPPRLAPKLTGKKLTEARVLASPYECGRVLEADEPVMIDGVPYVITVKGVGCTAFARQTGAENPWMLKIHRSFTEDQRKRLEKFPFMSPGFGWLDLKDAQTQIIGAEAFSGSQVDRERVLAVYKIIKLADAGGVLRPLSYFIDHGILLPDVQPALMVRAVKSNFRLLEPVMLNQLKKKACLAPFFRQALQEFRLHEGRPSAGMQDYFNWLSAKIVRQEMPFIVGGYEMSSGRWQDLGRNISILGEELDLEDVKPRLDEFRNEYEYCDHIKRHFSAMETAVRKYAEMHNESAREKII